MNQKEMVKDHASNPQLVCEVFIPDMLHHSILQGISENNMECSLLKLYTAQFGI